MAWLASLALQLLEWILSKSWDKFWAWRASVAKQKADAAAAKVAADQLKVDKANAKTVQESADAGKKFINS